MEGYEVGAVPNGERAMPAYEKRPADAGNIWAEPEPGKRVRICVAVPLASVSWPAGAV